MRLVPPPRRYDYERDGAAIYRASFATIRAETDLTGLPADAEPVAVRMVHASGQTDLTRDLAVHPDLVPAARHALAAGAPVLCDAQMVAAGVTRARLPVDNDVVCLVRDPRVPALADAWGTTRSAAAVSLWADRLEGAVVAIGNAPTALFHLLEMLDAGAPRPATAVAGSPRPAGRRAGRRRLRARAAPSRLPWPRSERRGRRSRRWRGRRDPGSRARRPAGARRPGR